jgi:hypothetical protein
MNTTRFRGGLVGGGGGAATGGAVTTTGIGTGR